MKRLLKEHLRDHLSEQSLNDAQLNALLKKSDPATIPDAAPRVAHTPVLQWCAGVALAVVCLALSGVYWYESSLPQRIAGEVARNHLNLKPADIETASLSEIGNELSLLNFKLVDSQQLAASSWELTGARYCEILGDTAAQLRYTPRTAVDESVETVYQVKHRRGWFNVLPSLDEAEQPLEILTSGLRVRVWTEQGIVFAMTVPPT